MLKDKQVFFLMGVLYIASGLLNEHILEGGVSTGLFLLLRSSLILAISMAYSKAKRISIAHKVSPVLVLRLLCSGLGMYGVLSGYQYISATLVSVLQKTDIIFIFLIGLWYGYRLTKFRGALLLSALFVIVIMILLSGDLDEDLLGYAFVLGGVVLLSVGAHLAKQMSVLENQYVLINVSCYSGIAVGLTMVFLNGYQLSNPTEIVPLIFLASIVTFYLFRLLSRLYLNHNPEVIQFPSLIAAFLIIIPEMVFEQKVFDVSFIVCNTLYLLIITLFLFHERILRILLGAKEQSVEIINSEL